MAAEQGILKGQGRFGQMAALVRAAAAEGRPIHQVERGLWERMLAVGRAMLGAFLAGVGTGDVGPTLAHEGRQLRRLGATHPRRYVSVLGELSVERHVYGSRETQRHELVPTDARPGLPEGPFSYLLQDWEHQLCVEGPYAEARGTIEKILGVGRSVDSLEHVNLAIARQAGPFLDARQAPVPPAPTNAAVEEATTSPPTAKSMAWKGGPPATVLLRLGPSTSSARSAG